MQQSLVLIFGVCSRSKETSRDDFIFYSRRLMRLLIEDVMSMLPFSTITVDTPQGFSYEGKRLDVKQVCVSHCHLFVVEVKQLT